MRAAAALLLLGFASCRPVSEDAPEQAEASATPRDDWDCADNDVQCRNAVLWTALQRKWTRYPPWKLDQGYGTWQVVAAIEDDPSSEQGEFSSVDRRVPRFVGSTVKVGPEAIVFIPARPGIASTDQRQAADLLYPRCTKPEFNGDIRQSASPMRELIEPWRRFGVQENPTGRYFMIACRGGPEFAPDPDGHASELSVEDAHGP